MEIVWTKLYFIQKGSLTSERYLDEILKPFVLPYAAVTRKQFSNMDGNDRSYTANIVNNWFEDLEIDIMD